MTELQKTILKIVHERQRNYPPHRGVLPLTIACFLDEYRAEQTVRRDCVQLWQAGQLDRLGGERSRRGYRIPVLKPVVEVERIPEVAALKLVAPKVSIIISIKLKVA